MRKLKTSVLLGIVLFLLSHPSAECRAGALTEDQRVRYQRALEEVYWRHRIWPSVNQSPKPSLDAVLPEASLRAKVEDYLKKSNALESHWHRPITAQQLQAEMDRMARDTRQPAVLSELFAALNNDPTVIAECLARPLLADRLVHNMYAGDERFHAAVKRQAESELMITNTIESLRATSGVYRESVWTKEEPEKDAPGPREDGSVLLDPQQWDDWIAQLQQKFTPPAQDAFLFPGLPDAAQFQRSHTSRNLPVMKISPLQEDSDRFYVVAVLERGPDRVRLASVDWAKPVFHAWWQTHGNQMGMDIIQPSFEYRLPSPAAGIPSTPDTWSPTATGAPGPRYVHTAVWTGSEMIIWGGTNGSTVFNNGARYNPATDTWAIGGTSPINAPSGRYLHTAVWTGTEMIIWGGYGPFLNTGGRYNPVTDTWAAGGTSTINAPDPRDFHSAVWTGSEMIIWGGYNGGYMGTGGRYNPSTDTWAAGGTSSINTPSARYQHTSIWTGTEMIVWGGVDGGFTNTGGRYDPATNTWAAGGTSTTNAPIGRYQHTAIWTGSEMIIWGGNFFNTGGRYNPSTDSWTAGGTSTTDAPASRSLHTAVWTGTEMIIWGGTDGSAYLNTGGRYNPTTNAWAAGGTSMTNAPGVRQSHVTIWTGTEMIVWGGYNDAAMNTGGRYDPSTDTWAPGGISTGAAPTGRFLQTSVWTGAEVIIWGGTVGFPPLNTGGRYDPATDIWAAGGTSVFNAPEPRSSQVAIWTGSQMIVWGGLGASAYLNTGGLYDPITDTWTPGGTSTTNAPTGRITVGVWTGSEMIIWGGGDGTNLLNTGGRYNPSTDSWAPGGTSMTNAPTARSSHSLIWTGSEMVLWGGYDFGYTNTGERYNPTTDTWAASGTATTGAPIARGSHSALWTGSEMIIWGGRDSIGNPLNTGGRYNPATDTWAPGGTATANVPTGRISFTAVWTGISMIIWGGYDGSGEVNTGGIYYPSNNSWFAGGTSTINAPSARDYHTAVWTGSEMVVWGGVIGLGIHANTGGRYIPPAGAGDLPATDLAVDNADSPDPVPQGGNIQYTIGVHNLGPVDALNVILSDDVPANTTFVSVAAPPDWACAAPQAGATGNVSCASAVLTASTSALFTLVVQIDAGAPGGDTITNTASVFASNPDPDSSNNNATATTTVNCPAITLSPQALANGISGVPYLEIISASGGTAPYAFAVTAGALPNGLTLNPATGEINGTPGAAGVFDFTITATDANGCSGSQSYSIQIDCPGIGLLPGVFPSPWVLGQPVNVTISGSGGTAPYTFAVTGGAFPNGLTLNSTTGDVTGIVSFPGFFAFTITATDANGCSGFQDYFVEVLCPIIFIFPQMLPNPNVGIPYLQMLSSGSVPPIFFSVIGGMLPPGLSLDSATGVISGTPTTAGPFDFTIMSTDALGCTAFQGYHVDVTDTCTAIALSPDSLPDAQIGAAYSQAVNASGGTAPYSFAITAGSLPGGLILDAGTGVISGTPTAIGAASFTITATDATGCSGSRDYSITVTPSCLFCDDFEDGVLATDWTYVKPQWSETGGELVGTPSGKKAVAVASPVFTGCLNCSVEATIQTAGGTGNRLWLLAWYVDKKNAIELMMNQEGGKWLLKERSNGRVVAKAKGLATINPNTPYDVMVSFDGTRFTVTVDGLQLMQLTPVATVPPGTVGFSAKSTTARIGAVNVN